MLYIFDLGNVIINLDFNRALGVWSKFSGMPLANLQSKFSINDTFARHERGDITDEEFAEQLCTELDINLSYAQFVSGWQSIFTGINNSVIEHIKQLKVAGHRVVILSNTNNLHSFYWPAEYPQIAENVDRIYLSQEMGARKPEPAIYQMVLAQEGVQANDVVYFDDNQENIYAAKKLGLEAIWVSSPSSIDEWFSKQP